MSNAQDSQRKALGKGLSALFPGRPVNPPLATGGGAAPALAPVATPVAEVVAAPTIPSHLPISKIQINPVQPRGIFEPDRLEDLAQSIRANGIIQPLVVRMVQDHYQLVAGERRLRAATMAGLAEVPVSIQEIPDERLLEITLIENIQREDLNSIEVALAFERLAHELNLSHEEIARRTGKDRSTITNLLRLLRLPAEVQGMVADSKLSMGQARAILGLPEPEQQIEIARKASGGAMSVRAVEQMVQKLTRPAPEAEEPPAIDPNVKAAIQEMERVLGTRVKIIEKSVDRGRIEIEYYTADDLDRIYGLIVGEP
ncbi:MAG: ParB/RepB/Spo0J family partition protein [Parafilimonas sp.]